MDYGLKLWSTHYPRSYCWRKYLYFYYNCYVYCVNFVSYPTQGIFLSNFKCLISKCSEHTLVSLYLFMLLKKGENTEYKTLSSLLLLEYIFHCHNFWWPGTKNHTTTMTPCASWDAYKRNGPKIVRNKKVTYLTYIKRNHDHDYFTSFYTKFMQMFRFWFWREQSFC